MRIAPRPSAPTAAKPAKPAESTSSPSAPALDHFSTAVTEGSAEFFIAKASELNTGDRDGRLQELNLRLEELALEKHSLTATIDQLEAKLSGPSPDTEGINQKLDQARAELATVDSEISDVKEQIAALESPPPAPQRLNLSAALLRSKPIIP